MSTEIESALNDEGRRFFRKCERLLPGTIDVSFDPQCSAFAPIDVFSSDFVEGHRIEAVTYQQRVDTGLMRTDPTGRIQTIFRIHPPHTRG